MGCRARRSRRNSGASPGWVNMPPFPRTPHINPVRILIIFMNDRCLRGLISGEATIIPIHNWIPKDMAPADAVQLFLASSHVGPFAAYASYTVYLYACTLGVLFGPSANLAPPPPSSFLPCSPCVGSPDEGACTSQVEVEREMTPTSTAGSASSTRSNNGTRIGRVR